MATPQSELQSAPQFFQPLSEKRVQDVLPLQSDRRILERLSFLPRYLKPRWPDPENSCGDEFASQKSHDGKTIRRWNVIGPALEAYREIEANLEDLLNARDDLADDQDQK